MTAGLKLQKVLMLDVDGVLVTGRPDGLGHWSVGLKGELGIDPDGLKKHFFEKHWSEVVIGQRDLSESLAIALREMGTDVSADTLIEYWFSQDSRVNADVLAGMNAIRQSGIPVWLATNQEHQRAEYLMRVMGLGEKVDGIVYSGQLGTKKPDLWFFAKAGDRIGAQQYLLVDDTLENVEAAKRVGWSAVHWTGERSLEAICREIFLP